MNHVELSSGNLGRMKESIAIQSREFTDYPGMQGIEVVGRNCLVPGVWAKLSE